MGLHGFAAALTLTIGVLTLTPVSAQANFEEGRPETYTNNVRMTTSPVGFNGWGPIHWASEALGTNIECVQLYFGHLNNEGVPTFGTGQILGWTAQGDASTGGVGARRSCKFTKTGVEGEPEAWVTDEPSIETVRNVPLSMPWNMRFECVEIESSKFPLVRVGLPTGAPGRPAACETEAQRAAQIEKEETERTGCYATTVPEGCVKLTWVVPALGIEETFEGSEQPRWKSAFTSGVHPSFLEFEGASVGKLHLHGSFSTTAVPSGDNVVHGFVMQLITVK
jgi:hypothetical protein